MNRSVIKNSGDMALVAVVVEAGSISAGSPAIGLERTSVSRRLKLLEQRLGIALFDRTGKDLQLTEAGIRFYQYCRRILETAEEAEAVISGADVDDGGILNINTSFSGADRLLSPIVQEFSAANPGIQVALKMTSIDDESAVGDGEFTLCLSPPRRQGQRWYRLMPLRQWIYASPEWVEAVGAVDPSDAIAQIPCVGVADATDGKTSWLLSSDDGRCEAPIVLRFRLDDSVACREACVAGLGIAVLPEFLCRREERTGSLVRLFPSWRARDLNLVAIHSSDSILSRKARQFIDHCRQQYLPA